jgi:hypothetical protein
MAEKNLNEITEEKKWRIVPIKLLFFLNISKPNVQNFGYLHISSLVP